MKFTTDITLLFVLAVNNDKFYMLQLWTLKLTETKKMFCISCRLAVKLAKYQRNLHGKQWFPTEIYVVNGPHKGRIT